MKITITEVTSEEFKELGTFLKETFPGLKIELLNVGGKTVLTVIEERDRTALFYKNEWGLSAKLASVLARRYKSDTNGKVTGVDSPTDILSMADEILLEGRNFGPSSLKQLREAIAGRTKEELLANLDKYKL